MHPRRFLTVAVVASLCASPKPWLSDGHCSARSISVYNNGHRDVRLVLYQATLSDREVSLREQLYFNWQRPSLTLGSNFSYQVESERTIKVRRSDDMKGKGSRLHVTAEVER